MSRRLIKNGVVNMEWDAEQFFESKSKGFVAAIHIYTLSDGREIPVGFKEGLAFVLTEEDGETWYDYEKLVKAIKEAHDSGYEARVYFDDIFISLANDTFAYDEECDFFGFTEDQKEDMVRRVEDLKSYWELELIEM